MIVGGVGVAAILVGVAWMRLGKLTSSASVVARSEIVGNSRPRQDSGEWIFISSPMAIPAATLYWIELKSVLAPSFHVKFIAYLY